MAAVLTIGFFHAFEIDHLAAVSNIVTSRKTIWAAIKDGIFWGIGHSTTIFAVGIFMIGLRYSIAERYFSIFEALVGLMLIGLGLYRFFGLYQKRNIDDNHTHQHSHHLAFGVGLIHGLAGSGSVILLVISQVHSSSMGLLFLVVFGVGTIVGMLVAAGIFSLPFSKRINRSVLIKKSLAVLSSILCIGVGALLITENLWPHGI